MRNAQQIYNTSTSPQLVRSDAIVGIMTSLRCCLLVSHFKYSPCWRCFCLADYGQTWRHSQNRKYITYYSVVRRRLGHGHRQQVAYSLWSLAGTFLDMTADRQHRWYRHTDIQAYRHAHRNISHLCRGRSNKSYRSPQQNHNKLK